MKISQIIKAGKQKYQHHYLQTQVGCESADHELDVPAQLSTLAENDGASVVIYGDDSLGIEIDGKLWAAELPDPEQRPAKKLPHEIWQYLNLALGRNGDTSAS